MWRAACRVIGVSLGVLLLIGAGTSVWLRAQPLPSADTPSGSVRRYFTLVSLGREVEAQRLRADEPPLPAWVGLLPFVPTDEFALGGLRVDGGTAGPGDFPPPSFAAGYRDITYVGAAFSQHWGDGATTVAGKQYREVVVGRRAVGAPWVILAVGTGG